MFPVIKQNNFLIEKSSYQDNLELNLLWGCKYNRDVNYYLHNQNFNFISSKKVGNCLQCDLTQMNWYSPSQPLPLHHSLMLVYTRCKLLTLTIFQLHFKPKCLSMCVVNYCINCFNQFQARKSAIVFCEI